MKTSNKIMAGLLMASLIISGSVFAAQGRPGQGFNNQSANGQAGNPASFQNGSGDPQGEGMKPGKRPDGPAEMLGKFQFENMAVQTISELSSQTVETVAAKLAESRLHEVLKAYNITNDAFQAAMKPKFIALVQKRVEDGSITAAQQTLILAAMEKQGTRQETMAKLIQNGVTAGIITQEEADKMLAHGAEEPPAE